MMSGYLVNFAVYTMAMLGLIFFALMIYQKVSQNGGFGLKRSAFLEVEETLSMGARKTLYVVRAGNERFLLASDMEKTSFIAKLDENSTFNIEEEDESYSLDDLYDTERPVTPIKQAPRITPKSEPKQSIDELPVIVDFSKKKQGNKVIKNMLHKINE